MNTDPANPRSNRPIRVLTNASWLDGASSNGRSVTSVPIKRGSLWRQLLQALTIGRYDGVLLNNDPRFLFMVCAAKKLMPWARCKVVSVDLFLYRPKTALDRVRRWLLSEVDRFILYYRDTSELEALYRIRPGHVRYVPFKVNTIESVVTQPTTDEGFFLACGRSNRDYHTLCEAFRDLPYECRILAPWTDLEYHGTKAAGLDCPA